MKRALLLARPEWSHDLACVRPTQANPTLSLRTSAERVNGPNAARKKACIKGVSRAMFVECLPVRVCFFALKAASYLAQAFFFTEKYEPVGSYL